MLMQQFHYLAYSRMAPFRVREPDFSVSRSKDRKASPPLPSSCILKQGTTNYKRYNKADHGCIYFFHFLLYNLYWNNLNVIDKI